MTSRPWSVLNVKKGLRAISFHAGVGVGLLLVGIYLAVISHRWFAVAALVVVAIVVGSIPLCLPRVRK
jgi:hypothetical protein